MGSLIRSRGCRPDQHFVPGMSYMITDGDVHFAKVQGNRAIKLLCVFIGDENKPVARVMGSPEAR